MKVLTLWQPYSQAIALGLKQYETRSWPTRHRGLLAIHCSVKPLSKPYKELADKYEIIDKLQYGKIVVICDLTDCILMSKAFIQQQSQTEIDFGDWRIGRYAWKLKIVEILKEPVAIKGRQGLWNTDLLSHLNKIIEASQLSMNLG